MKNKDTFILLQELYDSIEELIFCYENNDNNIYNLIEDVKQCYNNLKEEEDED